MNPFSLLGLLGNLTEEADTVVESLLRVVAPRAPDIVVGMVGDAFGAGVNLALDLSGGIPDDPEDLAHLVVSRLEDLTETLREVAEFTDDDNVHLGSVARLVASRIALARPAKPIKVRRRLRRVKTNADRMARRALNLP